MSAGISKAAITHEMPSRLLVTRKQRDTVACSLRAFPPSVLLWWSMLIWTSFGQACSNYRGSKMTQWCTACSF